MLSKEAAQFLRALADAAVDDDCKLNEWQVSARMAS